MIERKKR